MDYDIFLAPSGTHVVCRVLQPITEELARTFTRDLRRFGMDHSLRVYLLDLRQTSNTLSVIGNYQLANKTMPELDVSRTARCAVLAAPGDRSHEFLQMAMSNAGYNVQLFQDEAVAVAWLEEGGAR